MKTAFTAETQSRRERRLWSLFSVSLRLCGGLFAFVSCTTPPPAKIEEKPDEPRPREAQSDFLDIGKQAGIEWLSFVPNDQREFPELFEGLDRDQKRHLRLAPLERPEERVLLEFKLPPGSKLWPVDWYGKELMAIEVPGVADISLAIAATGDPRSSVAARVANERSGRPRKGDFDDGTGGVRNVTESDGIATLSHMVKGGISGAYGDKVLSSRSGSIRVVVESLAGPESVEAVRTVLAGISIRRDLALEGFPKHKCSSSVEDLQAGKLVFPGGTLSLPLKAGQVARKTGGDSTIQVDGEGAKPWLILRRLKESGAEGDIRTRVRLDTTFARRVEKPSGRFSAGQRLASGAIAWDYADSGAEQQLVGVIATGKELLAFEVVSQGLGDGEARRHAREAARNLIGEATCETPQGEPLKVLEGWNVGTMGRD